MKWALKFLVGALLLVILSKKLFKGGTITADQAAQSLRAPVALQAMSNATARMNNLAKQVTPPAAQTWSDVFGSLLVNFVGFPLVLGAWAGLLCIAGFNLGEWYHYSSPKARDERSLPSLSLTPLRSLVPAPGAAADAAVNLSPSDGALVWVEGWLCGDPPIAAYESPDQLYALQCLRVTHEVVWDTPGETVHRPWIYTDYRHNYRPRLWLNVGLPGEEEGRVEVCLPKNWRRFSSGAFQTVAKVHTPVAAPENIKRMLALQSVVPARGQEWELWAIPQNAHVTVLAPAHLRQGRVVLELDKSRFGLVSPGTWQYVAAPSLPLWVEIGGLGLLVFLASLPLLWHYWKR